MWKGGYVYTVVINYLKYFEEERINYLQFTLK